MSKRDRPLTDEERQLVRTASAGYLDASELAIIRPGCTWRDVAPLSRLIARRVPVLRAMADAANAALARQQSGG